MSKLASAARLRKPHAVCFLVTGMAATRRKSSLVTHNALVTERERSGAGNGVGDVVVRARRVVDAVPTAARRPAFQPAELGHETRMVEQLDAPAVQQRQKVDVQVGLWPRALLAAASAIGNSRAFVSLPDGS